MFYGIQGMNVTAKRTLFNVFVAGMLTLHLFLAWILREPISKGYPDFTIFYSAAKILVEGKGTQLYDPTLQYEIQRSFAPDVKIRQAALPYNHPPFEAFLFVPLSEFSYLRAYLVWNLINLFILVLLTTLLRSHVAILRNISIVSTLWITLAFFPIFINCLQGQDSLVLLLVFSISYIFFKKDRDFLAGCFLALGLFRFQFIFLVFLWLLWRRRSQALLGFGFLTLCLVGVSIAAVGLKTAMHYPFYVWQLEQQGAGGAIVPANMPNLHGLITTIFASFAGNTTVAILVILASLGLVIAAAKNLRSINFDLEFSRLIIVTVLISYHSYAHDLSLLVLPILFVANYIRTAPALDHPTRLGLVAPIIFLYLSPLYMILWFRYQRLSFLTVVLLFLAWGLSREIAKFSRNDTPGSANGLSEVQQA